MNREEFEDKFFAGKVSDAIWQWIEGYAIGMCKKQRELCAIVYNDNVKIKGVEITRKLWDASLPKELIK